MTKDEFKNLLANTVSVTISLLGQTIKIIQMRSGAYEIGSITNGDHKEYASLDDMMDSFVVMNMSLGDLTRWMRVEAAA